MAHSAQREFCKEVRRTYPHHFRRCAVADIGSLDINGNNKYLFSNCSYVGVDIGAGRNVDVVAHAHHYLKNKQFKTIISTEMLEHDIYWQSSLESMYAALETGGLLVITCATDGRMEHGTLAHEPESSPATVNYYKNITIEMFLSILHSNLFLTYSITKWQGDLQFHGLKK